MQLTLDIQVDEVSHPIQVAHPYSLAGRLIVVKEYRLKLELKELSKATGMTLNEVKKLCRLLDGLVPEALAKIQTGQVGESVALKLVKLTRDRQRDICSVNGVVRLKDVESVLKDDRASQIQQLPEDLFLPGFELDDAVQENPPPKDSLIGMLIKYIQSLPPSELEKVAEYLAVSSEVSRPAA